MRATAYLKKSNITKKKKTKKNKKKNKRKTKNKQKNKKPKQVYIGSPVQAFNDLTIPLSENETLFPRQNYISTS